MPEYCRNHIGSHYQNTSTAAANVYIEIVQIDVQLQTRHKKIIEENK